MANLIALRTLAPIPSRGPGAQECIQQCGPALICTDHKVRLVPNRVEGRLSLCSMIRHAPFLRSATLERALFHQHPYSLCSIRLSLEVGHPTARKQASSCRHGPTLLAFQSLGRCGLVAAQCSSLIWSDVPSCLPLKTASGSWVLENPKLACAVPSGFSSVGRALD